MSKMICLGREIRFTHCPQNRKQAFRRRADAELASQALSTASKQLYVYECPHCGKWHLTKLRQAA